MEANCVKKIGLSLGLLLVMLPVPALAASVGDELARAAGAIRAEETSLVSLSHEITHLEAQAEQRVAELKPRLGEAEKLLRVFLAAPVAVPFWRHDLADLADGAAMTGESINQLRPLLAALLREQAQTKALQEKARSESSRALAKREALAQAYAHLKTLLARQSGNKGRPAQQSQHLSLEALLAALAKEASKGANHAKRGDGPDLSVPVAGLQLAGFGEVQDFGGNHAGLRWQGLGGGLITAPVAGEVLYAGLFRAYQKILILDAGKGYHMVLTGLDEITTQAGAQVEAGQPLGWLAQEEAELYMELRHLNQPVDPEPFMQ